MKIYVPAIIAIALLSAEAHSQPVLSGLTLDPQTLSFAKSFRASSLITDEVKGNLPPPVTLRTELTELFADNGCLLPQSLRNRLRQLNGREALIPKDLVDILGEKTLDVTLQKYPDRTANAVLHSVTIPVSNNQTRQLSLVGAESYKKRSASDFLDSESSDFAFTMDCSGYLSAALRTNVNIPAAEINQSADAALKSSNSMIVMRGHVFSPTAAAMVPTLGGAGLTDRERLDLLYAIIAEVISDGESREISSNKDKIVNNDTPITAWRKIDVVWTSNRGESSMTGRASIAGSGAFGMGLASVSASAGLGGSVSRQVKFSSFNTYIIDAKVLEPVQRPLGALKATLKDELRRIRQTSTSTVNSNVEVLYPAMPEKVCKLPWTASTSANAALGEVVTSWSDHDGCKVIFSKVPGLVEKSLLEIRTSVFDETLTFPLQLP